MHFIAVDCKCVSQIGITSTNGGLDKSLKLSKIRMRAKAYGFWRLYAFQVEYYLCHMGSGVYIIPSFDIECLGDGGLIAKSDTINLDDV